MALAVLAVAAAFLLIGVYFVTFPADAAVLFGTPPPDAIGLVYLRAIGVRDLALALYLVGLLLGSTRRALGFVLGASVLIPVCDVIILAMASGLDALPSLAAHAGAGATLGCLSLWCFRSGERAGPGDPEPP